MGIKEKKAEKSQDIHEKTDLRIILYNDEVNTFDFVIESLVDVCDHELVQAEQCAFITHFKGKCAVLTGSKKYLEPKCSKLNKLGLTANIK
jgi:ATP-dependent Clp protease adaptor protein ClpS